MTTYKDVNDLVADYEYTEEDTLVYDDIDFINLTEGEFE